MQEVPVYLPHKYSPREYQSEFWRQMNVVGKKRACLLWHRRSGKDLTIWNYTIQQAFEKAGNYFYIFPSYAQGRKVIWDGKDKEGNTFLSYIPKEILHGVPNNTMMQVKIRCNPKKNPRSSEFEDEKISLIQILGSDNIDALMGTSMQGAVFSEYSLQDPKAWQYIRPILTETGGWAIFCQTPRGFNHGKELFDMAKTNKDWFCQKLTVEDTVHKGSRVITDKDIQSEREAGMSEDYISQEFYCSFNLGIDGSYYGWYLEKAKEEGRITSVPWEPQTPVSIAMDLGIGDATAIVFFQLVGKEIHIIDYYENQGRDFAHYAKIIKEKPYVYDRYFAPHDAMARELGTGLSCQDVSSSLGINLTILPTLKIGFESGIEATRSIFPRIWIDQKKCDRLIKCLGNYQKIHDDKNNTYKNTPLHDWSSHGSDAFRYLAIAAKMYGNKDKGIDDNEYQRMVNRYLPKFN